MVMRENIFTLFNDFSFVNCECSLSRHNGYRVERKGAIVNIGSLGVMAIEWREREHKVDNNLALNDLEIFTTPINCRLLNFSKLQI